jgi:hypothetical protein
MHKVYLLLRNNKQLGPFSLDELLQQSLQPFDLVWVEGRSAGWRYPTEIDTLKAYVAAEPEAMAEVLTEPVIHSAAINTAVAVIPEPDTKKQVYVRLPSTPGKPAQVEELKEEESMAEKLEKKAAALYQRAQAYAAGERNPPADAPEHEIKYSRSLDDIKEEYSSWLYTQRTGKKKNLRVNKRVILFSAAVLAICGMAGYYFLSGTPANPDPVQEVTQAINTPPVLPETTPAQNALKVKKKSRSAPVTATKKKKLSSAPVTAGVKKQAAAKQRAPSGTTITDNAPMNLADLVQVQANYAPDDEKGVPEFRITVKNNSDVLLRFVAVDVYYHRDKGASDKKTIYFRNISPHQSVSLMAPANKKADDVHLQMGLLSSSNGDLYYATN